MLVTLRNRSIILIITVLVVALLPTYTVQSQAAPQSQPTAQPIVVGSKEFTESILVGKMWVYLLREGGFEVEDQTGYGGTTALREALEQGEVDLYPESSGTALVLFHELPPASLPGEPERSYQLASTLDAAQGIVWLEPNHTQDGFGVYVNGDLAAAGVKTIEDLSDRVRRNGDDITACVWEEVYGREADGLVGLEATYDFAFKEDNLIITDLDGAFDGLHNGQCQVTIASLSDGRIAAWGAKLLDDPLGFFPTYVSAPTVRQEILDAHPDIAELLNKLAPYVTREAIRSLDMRIDLGADGEEASGDEEDIDAVVQDFLRSVGLMKLPKIVVGSKEYTESILLGKMWVHLLQDAGYEVDDQTGYGGTTAIRAALEKGELDMYPEFSGTALVVYHKLPPSSLPAEQERSFALAKTLDAAQGIMWLAPNRYVNGFAVMVNDDLAAQGIATLDDLAELVNADANAITACVWDEVYGRVDDGLVAMEAAYDFTFAEDNVIIGDLDGVFSGLHDGQCQVAIASLSDGRVAAWGFNVLSDPRGFFPTYVSAPIVRKAILDANPAIADILNQLAPFLTQEAISQLNARVDIGADGVLDSGDEEDVDTVAQDFLRSKRLVKLPPLTVASKTGTEQLILGQMLVLLLENAGYEVNNQVGMGDSPTVHKAIENDEIDLYPESTTAALVGSHNLPVTALPTDSKRSYTLVKNLDERRGLIWLANQDYGSSYALLVRDDLWNADVQSIDALAAYTATTESELSICVATDLFGGALDGPAILESGYKVTFAPENIKFMALDAVYQALRSETCTIATGDSTDGRVAVWGFHALTDTRKLFPVNNMALVVRQAVLQSNPDLADLLNDLTARLDEETVRGLNAQVDLGPDGEFHTGDEPTPQGIAETFLKDAGLLVQE
ncbi:MAG: glycine betaine ABC transporter substrate-binding protein [Caldilineaceae bacterium]